MRRTDAIRAELHPLGVAQEVGSPVNRTSSSSSSPATMHAPGPGPSTSSPRSVLRTPSNDSDRSAQSGPSSGPRPQARKRRVSIGLVTYNDEQSHRPSSPLAAEPEAPAESAQKEGAASAAGAGAASARREGGAGGGGAEESAGGGGGGERGRAQPGAARRGKLRGLPPMRSVSPEPERGRSPEGAPRPGQGLLRLPRPVSRERGEGRSKKEGERGRASNKGEGANRGQGHHVAENGNGTAGVGGGGCRSKHIESC